MQCNKVRGGLACGDGNRVGSFSVGEYKSHRIARVHNSKQQQRNEWRERARAVARDRKRKKGKEVK